MNKIINTRNSSQIKLHTILINMQPNSLKVHCWEVKNISKQKTFFELNPENSSRKFLSNGVKKAAVQFD